MAKDYTIGEIGAAIHVRRDRGNRVLRAPGGNWYVNEEEVEEAEMLRLYEEVAKEGECAATRASPGSRP